MTKINIVLYHPEIPQNTANIIRTAIGLNAKLHLIKPYGFDLNLSSKVFKRNSANYIDEVDLVEHEDFDSFILTVNETNCFFVSRYGVKTYSDIDIKKSDEDIYYIFGNESSGIDKEVLSKYKSQTFRIPMNETMRSLNLANCVALVCYEGARQQNFESLSFVEVQKKDYWQKGEVSGK